jgi:DNA-binding response OmpR family regulator
VAKVLIIDDDITLCEFVRDALREGGHEVEAASELDGAYDRLTHSFPDVVLLDVRMPEITGLELLPRIKAFHPATSVIIITAVDDYHLEDLFFEFGADGYLVKPFRARQLLEAIDRLLQQKPA